MKILYCDCCSEQFQSFPFLNYHGTTVIKEVRIDWTLNLNNYKTSWDLCSECRKLLIKTILTQGE